MINLDVCCGQYKHKDFVGMDKRDVGGVDIVHNVQEFPWPLDDNSCHLVLFRLAWSSIEPKYRLQLMDEFWRVIAPGGQLHIVDQYYKGDRVHHDPLCYSCPNEWTFLYFTPSHEKYKVYGPRPWEIIRYEYQERGLLVAILNPIKEAQA